MERKTNWGAHIFLVLFPAAIGCALGGLLLDASAGAGRFPVTYLSVALAAALVAAAAPVLGIKKPARAYRMLTGVTRSPLSRQAVLVGLSIVLLLVEWALALGGIFSFTLGVVTVVVGALAVLTAGLVYRLGSQPAWRHWSSVGTLFAGLLGLGVSLALVLALGWRDGGLLEGAGAATARVLVLVGAVLLLVALWSWRRTVARGGQRTEAVEALAGGSSRWLYVTGLLAAVLVAGVATAVSFASPWLMIVAFLGALAGLCLLRRLFFAVAAPLTWRAEVNWSRPQMAAGREG